MDFLLITANVGSVFEDPSRLLNQWVKELLNHVTAVQPSFIALHMQEVGGKTYEKSMEYVQEFIKILCESKELQDYNRIRVYLDEDFLSAEHFTALGNLYFAKKSINNIKIWNFLTHEWEGVDGKQIHTGNIESVATKEKAKFPQHFFPECKWSRKGFLRTRWIVEGTTLDMINIHLFHDASNLAACEEFPSVYCKSRRRALVHTLERFHKDSINTLVPFFLFGDFNFRCDTEGVVKKLTEELTEHRIQHLKNDNTKVQYRDSDGQNVLTVGKKEFTHADHQTKFKENWLREFDCEMEPLKILLHEFPITFPPTYPFEEVPQLPQSYMSTRCPAWCDRILLNDTAKKLMDNEQNFQYGIIGEQVCMGDHKPVYLSLRLRTQQGIYSRCEHATSIVDDTDKENLLENNASSRIKCLHCTKQIYSIIDRLKGEGRPALLSTAENGINDIIEIEMNGIMNEVQVRNNLNYTNRPLVSISVIDTDNNLNVCMCALMCNSTENLMNLNGMQQIVEEEDRICPICRNIIKLQPIEHRRTLVSKRLMLANDVVVNRIDTHYLSSTYNSKRLLEPYTPESVESHSPLPEMQDEREYPLINETRDSEEILESIHKVNHKEHLESEEPENDHADNVGNSSNMGNVGCSAGKSVNHTVSPRQLKSRLEILRRESELSCEKNGVAKKRDESKCCVHRVCVIL